MSQLSPRVCPFPLSSADKDTQRYHDIIIRVESREQSPSAGHIHPDNVSSLCLSFLQFYVTSATLWQYGADRTNFFFFYFFFKTGKSLWRKRPRLFLVAAERARLQGETWCLRESSQGQDITTALTSGHFQGLIMGNRVIQALVFAQLWSIKT